MKAFATYDGLGNIVGIAIPAADVKDGEFDTVAEPGHHVSEIEVPGKGKRERHEVIADLIQNYRVQRSAGSATFMKVTAPVLPGSKSDV
jgi:hypothetical protein